MKGNELLVIGLVLLMLGPLLFIGSSQTSMAANTVQWTEAEPPASSGTFVSQVCGDVNQDGHLDLIGGTLGLGVRVATGSGDGHWTALGAITTSGTYYGLDVGDVNNDGKLDVVAVEDGSGIHIWAGDGAGGWSPMDSPTGTGKYWSVALGDVNGDGKLDIAAGSGEVDGLKVWTGDGSGLWTSASTGLPGTGDYADLALGDVDRDGKPDLVAASHGAGVRAWQQEASWTERSGGLPDDGDYYGIALADLDHDGDLDVVASGDAAGVQAWRRSGDLTWTWSSASTGLPGDGQYWDVGIADVNNDGDPDVAASAYGSGVRVWTGDGGGTWSEVSDGLPVTGAFYGLTLGDFNDDGMPDLSAGHDAGVRAWLDAGTPDVLGDWSAIASPAREGSYQGLDVNDWNHDGKLDVVAAGSDTGIQLWEGDGGNTWDEIADWTSPDLPTSGDYAAVRLGDIDHNGWLDVVAGSGKDQGLRVWLFLDDVAWIDASGELPESGTYLDVDLGDLNNDGYLDIAAVGKELGVAAWTAEDFDTSSGWWDEASAGLPGSGTFLGVAFADLNHDGCLDVVAGSLGAGLSVWRGDCTGDWYARTTPTDSGTWLGVAVGDVNDDGQPDLVAASDSLGVQVWSGDGSFGWTPLTAPSGPDKVTDVDLGDLNHDGKLDILASKTTGLEVWTGDGGTTWTPFSANLPTTGSYPDAAFGEIDNDGVLDLIGAEADPGGVHAWTGAEGAPPSGWDDFSPTDWFTETRTVGVSVQVQDTGSGLDTDTAELATLEETGWSAWQHADCTGDKETTMPQTISAQDVTFSRDSGPYPHNRNQVRFRIQDMVGNVGYSGDYNVHIDTTPPTNPNTFTSSHAPDVWESDPTVEVDWGGAADETSGMDYGRYSYVFNTSCDLPDTIVDTAASMATSDPLDDGAWYVSVRTRDTAGVWAPDAACDGPYRIDTQPPTNPMTFMSTPDVGVWTRDNTVDITWSGAADAGSDVYGYSVYWSTSAHSSPDYDPDTIGTSDTSPALDEGENWFHIRTRDNVGNWSGVAHHGPFRIDRTPPFFCWINPPTESASSSFLVPWSCNDALSGIECYDVQVRDRAVGVWTDWQTCTTATSATYSGAQQGHTYQFRVRAHDRAGNVSEYLDDDQTLVPEDLEATGLEVTQAIQNLDNDVPLVANKDTYVRFYVRSSNVDMPDVDARLHGTRDGVALPGSPLRPAGGSITVLPDGGDRDNLDDAFYFHLPRDWRSGTVELRAVVNPDRDIAEGDYDDNEWTETLAFGASGDYCIVFVPVHVHPNTYYAGDPGFWDIVALMRWLHPVGQGSVDLYTGEVMYPSFHWAGYEYDLVNDADDPDDFNKVLFDLWSYDFWHRDPCDDTHYWGMIHPDTLSGRWGMANCPGDEGTGVMDASTSFDPGYPAWNYPMGGITIGHEFSHNFGREHVLCRGDEADGGAIDPDYPYAPCQIGPDDPTAYYGFARPMRGSGPEIITPTEATPLMSYSSPQWISDYTYRALLDEVRDLAAAQEVSLSPTWARAQEYLFVNGIISPTGQTAELRAFYRTSEPDSGLVAQSFQQEGKYSMVLEDADGVPIYTHTFTATTFTAYGNRPDTEVFAEVFPYDDRVARIVLKQGETELASRLVSAHPPVVTVLSPNGGEVISDHLTITWTGSDEDGDDLHYTVQYSPDDGQTWRVLALDWMGTSFEVDANNLSTVPGSDQASIRVIASDDVNTAEDRSDAAFTLTRKAPQAYIAEPKSGTEFESGTTVVLRGMSLDAEDGSLGDEAYAWSSNLSGTLGTGEELWVSDLAAGVHRIILAATDSDGDTGTDEIVIYVGVSPSRTYLPVVLKSR